MTASPAPSSPEEPDCYFTAKAVPIRASVASPAGLRVSTYSSSPISPHPSTSITPSQFPPPPGHSHPSFVFRKPPTPLATVRDSAASSTYGPITLADGRVSVLSATPSLFPQPPSANGTDAHIRPLFATARQSTLSSVSRLEPTPGPTPPPKEYHPTLSPATNDYFSPLAPAASSVQEPQPTAAGITRMSKPVPLDLTGNSAISPHSPVANPALTALTLQTLNHLSSTALRSPSLTFVESAYSPGLSPRLSRTGSASPLTSAQRDRLWEMKKVYDERRNRYEGSDEKGWISRRRPRASKGDSARGYLWAVIVLSLVALAGIVGLIVGITLAQKGGS